jgi:hypothetical protein
MVEMKKNSSPVFKLFLSSSLCRLTGDEDEEYGVTVSTFSRGYDGDLCRGYIAEYPASKSDCDQVAVSV